VEYIYINLADTSRTQEIVSEEPPSRLCTKKAKKELIRATEHRTCLTEQITPPPHVKKKHSQE
jgi:hypothetical protein